MKLNPKQISKDTYKFPHWSKVGKTHKEAVEKVLKEIEKSREFTNYIDLDNLRETERKRTGEAYQYGDGYLELKVQMGEKYKDKSPEEVRKSFDKNEFGLGVYEVGCILLANPDILKDFDDLWIDCAGDEYDLNADGSWQGVPFWGFGGERLGLDARWFGLARSCCGSASGFLPQSDSRNLESLDTFETLPSEFTPEEIQKLKKFASLLQ